jgi:hypothetical protein
MLMFSLKERLKLLTRIAQTAATTTPETGATPTAASTTAPTTPTATVAAPPAFSPASGPWAFITKAYNAPTVQYLSYLLGIINTTMHYASNGAYNLQKNQNDLGQIDPSALPSVDAKNVVLLAKLFYNTFLNHGKPFETPVQPAQIANWVHTISSSQPLMNLSQINTSGQLAQQLNSNFKLDGSFRQNVINYFGYIQTYNPQTAQQQKR